MYSAECGGAWAPLQTLSRAPRPACHSAILTPHPGPNPRSLTHFQKLRRDLHLQEIRPLMCQGNPWLPNSRPKTRAPHRMWIGLGLKCNHQSLQLLPGSPLLEMKWINVSCLADDLCNHAQLPRRRQKYASRRLSMRY